jgi:predicted nicotinamide N-methyase
VRLRSEQCILALAVVALALLVSCTRNVKETQLTTENAKFNLIIAGDSSDFKDKIRNKIIARYSNSGNIDVVNIDKLEDVRPEDYDVILIMDTCIGCEDFNWSMKSFLDRLEDNNNVVLLMTTGYADYEYSYGDVDAITAASRIADEEEIFTRLSEEIDRIIGGIGM